MLKQRGCGWIVKIFQKKFLTIKVGYALCVVFSDRGRLFRKICGVEKKKLKKVLDSG